MEFTVWWRTSGTRLAALALASSASCFTSSLGAPEITDVMASTPPHGQAGATVLLFATGLVSPVEVRFSDGTNPTVVASPVDLDLARGMAAVRVPAGAVTGSLQLTANGVGSDPYFFRREAGSFDRGTEVASGTVLGPGMTPVAGAMVALMLPTGCDGGNTFWDHAVTDASGSYTLHAKPGDYFLFVFPPRSSGLASAAAMASAPGSQNVVLSAGTTVNGRVVRQSSPGSGVAYARVDFEGDGYETALTDGNGYYSAFVAPGPSRLRVAAPPTVVLARAADIPVTVGSVSPQNLGDTALRGGVRIYGTVRRQADSSPMPGVWISGWSSEPCCPQVGETVAGGDGSYALVVSGNATYGISASVEDTEPYANARTEGIVVGTADVSANLSLLDAGFIRGVVTDRATALPRGGVQVSAHRSPWGSGASEAGNETCDDGSYVLRVPPSETGYVVTAGATSFDDGKVPVAWTSSGAGTFFLCEGTPVPVPAVGSQVSAINLSVPSNAGAMEGWIRTQSSGCTAPYDHSVWIIVDDGAQHACSLGTTDWSAPAGSYRLYGLPGSSLMPVLRACISEPGMSGVQCFDQRTWPDFTSVPVPPRRHPLGRELLPDPGRSAAEAAGDRDPGEQGTRLLPSELERLRRAEPHALPTSRSGVSATRVSSRVVPERSELPGIVGRNRDLHVAPAQRVVRVLPGDERGTDRARGTERIVRTVDGTQLPRAAGRDFPVMGIGSCRPAALFPGGSARWFFRCAWPIMPASSRGAPTLRWNPWRGLSGLPRQAWGVAAAVLVNRTGTMVLPFLVLYLTRELRFAPGRAGLAVSLYGLVALVASPIAGRLCDRFSHLAVMRASLFATGLILLAFPLARGWAGVVFATAALAAANEGFRPASLAILADLVPAEKHRAVFALNRLAINLGMSVGPALGGILVTHSFHSLFLVDGATSILAGMVLFSVAPVENPRRGKSPGTERADAVIRSVPAHRNARLLLFLVSVLPVGIVFFQHGAAMPLYLVRDLHFRESVFGLLFTLNTLLIVLLEVELNASTSRWPHRRTLALGALLTASGFGGLAVADEIWGVALTVVVWTFGEMILLPGIAAYVAAASPPDRRGEYMGMYTMTFGAAFAIGPWLGTELLERAGPRVLWTTMLALGALSAAMMWRTARSPAPAGGAPDSG